MSVSTVFHIAAEPCSIRGFDVPRFSSGAISETGTPVPKFEPGACPITLGVSSPARQKNISRDRRQNFNMWLGPWLRLWQQIGDDGEVGIDGEGMGSHSIKVLTITVQYISVLF